MYHNKLRLIKRLFKKRLSLIVRVNVVLNRTVVVDSDWHFDNLCGVIFIYINCHPSRIMFYYRVVQISIINGMLTAKVTCIDPYHHRRRRTDSRIKFNGQTQLEPSTSSVFVGIQPYTWAPSHCYESNLIQVVSSTSLQSDIWNLWGRHQGCHCGSMITTSVAELSVWLLTNEKACWVSWISTSWVVGSSDCQVDTLAKKASIRRDITIL